MLLDVPLACSEVRASGCTRLEKVKVNETCAFRGTYDIHAPKQAQKDKKVYKLVEISLSYNTKTMPTA